MSIKNIDIKKLIEWLGADGAIAGLEKSSMTVSELCDLAIRNSLSVERRARRSDIIVDLVNQNSTRIDKTMEELLAMNDNELCNYFKDRKVSRTELVNLLLQFDILPASHDKANLLRFAAREISDIGMYQRVATGSQRT